jgi:hypothetical protein
MTATNGKPQTISDVFDQFVNKEVIIKQTKAKGIVIGVDPRPNPGCGPGLHYKEGTWLVIKLLKPSLGKIPETTYALPEQVQIA